MNPMTGFLSEEMMPATRTKIVVDIGDLKVACGGEDTIITYSLGSCLGLSIYDPRQRIGGILHSMLPLAKMDTAKADARPAMFTDTGIQLFLQTLFDQGSRKQDLILKAAGCASPLDNGGHFRIGERNLAVLRKILWKNDLLLAGEDVGGDKARTFWLELATGRTVVRSQGVERDL